jgi:hypothetical protein
MLKPIKGIKIMNADEHRRKFEKTDALLNETCMDLHTTQYYDWCAILMFYGAIDLIERALAERPQSPHHSSGHVERNELASHLKRGTKLYSAMWALYNAGLDARYKPKFHTKEDVIELAKSYYAVKSIILSSLAS